MTIGRFRPKCLISQIITNFANMEHKTILSFLFAACAVCSCAKYEEDASIDKTTGTDMISATAESSESTRAKLNDKLEVVWGASDKISIVGSKSATFSLSSGEGTTKGTFTGDISQAGDGPYYAVMPYDANATASAEGVTFRIPQQKGAQNKNIAGSANPMAGKLYGDEVGFHNLFGLLKITFTSDNAVKVKKIALHDLAGNMLWGDCFIPVKADTLDYTDIRLTGGNNTITMVWNTPSNFGSTARIFYFPVPPGALDRGFSIVVYESETDGETTTAGRAYTFLQSLSTGNVAERSVICDLTAPKISEMSEPKDEKRRGFYKTLFINAGPKLTNNYKTSTFEWLNTLGLAEDYEYFAGDSTDNIVAKQASVINKNTQDDNGVLLYPDGRPRFCMVYCNGGKSSNHARTLYQDGRKRYHDFFHNGGSYVGTCAGGFLARSIYDGEDCYNNSDTTKNRGFGIWPGTMSSSGMPKNNTYFPTIYTAQKMEKAFGPFAAGDTIERVRHHGGFFINESSSPNKTIPHEILMRYQYTEQNTSDTTSYTEYNRKNYTIFNMGSTKSRAGEVSMIAYKKDKTTGRAVLCGSHPEGVKSGKNLQLMETMVTYALDGIGDPEIKGELSLGNVRQMDKSTSDNDPAYTKIGDKQYHHFKFTASADIENFKVELSSTSEADLHLALRKGGLAWRSDADYVLCNSGGNKSLLIKKLPAGLWYLSVYCQTTVTADKRTGGNNLAYIQYGGFTDVLNGVDYSILIDGSKL